MEAVNTKGTRYLSSEVKFYTISDLKKMLGWSEGTVQKLFNDPNFPAKEQGSVLGIKEKYYGKKEETASDGERRRII